LRKKLSQVLEDYDLNEYGNKICIVAGVGAGKNYWVEHVLAKEASVLLITSRKAVADQTEANDTGFMSYVSSVPIQQAVVYTHAKLGKLIRNSISPEGLFWDKHHFDYIVVDEAHCLVTDSTYANSVFHLWTFIEAALRENSKVILMSATIAPIKRKLESLGWNIRDLTDKCISVKPKNVSIISKMQAMQELKRTNSKNKALYMSTSATRIVTGLLKELNQNQIDINKMACIMSDGRKNELLSNSPKELAKSDKCYSSIIQAEILPDEIDILLCTSRLREGVNIKDNNIKMVFIESHNSIDVFQFIGRLRNEAENVYIIDDAKQNKPDKYAELDAAYCSEMELKNANLYLDKLLTKHKLNSHGKSHQNNYQNKHIKLFVDYIEKRFGYIRYNHFSNKFKFYNQRFAGIKDQEDDLTRYKKEKNGYIQEILGIDGIKYDAKSAKQIIGDYIGERLLFDHEIANEEIKKILEELTDMGILNSRKKPYKQLGSLLKANGYLSEIIGNNNNGVYKIYKT